MLLPGSEPAVGGGLWYLVKTRLDTLNAQTENGALAQLAKLTVQHIALIFISD